MMVLILSGIVPLVASLYPPLQFYRNTRALLASLFLVLFIFGFWDVYATYRGHWHFNPAAVWNMRIINLPLEEVLFFIVIPFCSIFTWETINYFKKRLR
jgi:lycopene cyclase domain-containing protein